MGLAYSGGTVQRVAIDGSTGTTIAADLVAALTAAGWTASVIAGGHSMLSATTSQGLSCIVEITVNAGNCRLQAKTADGSSSHTQLVVAAAGGRIYYAINNQYSFWLLLPSSTTGTGGSVTAYYAGVPFLPDPVEPLLVNGATNATPIVITTTTDHNLTSGDFVYIDGVGGNTAANGYFSIVVLSSTTFSLNSSVGNGAYTSGGRVGTADRISRCVYSGGNINGTFASSWRATPLGSSWGTGCLTMNETDFNSNDQQLQLLTSAAAPWRDGRYTITEPYVYAPITAGGTKYVQFQLWNTALISGTPAIAIDTTMSFDSHNWQVYGASSNCAIVVAYT